MSHTQTARIILAEEGLAGLFAGVVPRCVWCVGVGVGAGVVVLRQEEEEDATHT
jgi:hypothetical protein